MHRCRKRGGHGQTNILCAMRKMTLSKLPHWTWSSSDGRMAAWWTNLHQVQAHVKEAGTLPLIRSKLGSWLDHEKSKKTGIRTVEQKAALRDLLASSKTLKPDKKSRKRTVKQKVALQDLLASSKTAKRKHELTSDTELLP